MSHGTIPDSNTTTPKSLRSSGTPKHKGNVERLQKAVPHKAPRKWIHGNVSTGLERATYPLEETNDTQVGCSVQDCGGRARAVKQ